MEKLDRSLNDWRNITTCAACSGAATLTGRLHGTIVGPTGRSDWSVRPVGQTVTEPSTSVNQINVAF